ncbi:MAG: 50S ribosomal protein L22 [Alphaproteobacteria bacterium]|nr:50S ribosomal protein L22 [Alphaproteobacteria bacterium]
MGKPERERSLADNEAQAIGRMIRSSQYKLNLVAGLIRGKRVEQALADLTFSKKRIAVEVLKVLKSAVANAENNHNLDVDDLVVAQAWTGKDMVLKRFHARGRGRGASVLKPFSELTIIVREQAKEEKKAKAKGKGGKGKPAGKPAAAKKEAA